MVVISCRPIEGVKAGGVRGVVPRLVMAFNALKAYKRVLRLEEALRL